MSDIGDLFKQIEHIEFAANAGGAEDVEMFFSLTRPHPAVAALLGLRNAPDIMQRIQQLTRKPVDKKFMHPEDPALAVYLDTLYRMDAQEAVQQAWKWCMGNKRLHWTNQVAQSINLRQQSSEAVAPTPVPEPEPEPVVDAVSFPEPPAPIKLADFVRTFYGEYMRASRERAEAAGQTPPPRPAWDDIPDTHPVRLVFTDTCKALLARMQAVVYVPEPPTTPEQQHAVASAIRTGKLAARVTLLEME